MRLYSHLFPSVEGERNQNILQRQLILHSFVRMTTTISICFTLCRHPFDFINLALLHFSSNLNLKYICLLIEQPCNYKWIFSTHAIIFFLIQIFVKTLVLMKSQLHNAQGTEGFHRELSFFTFATLSNHYSAVHFQKKPKSK